MRMLASAVIPATAQIMLLNDRHQSARSIHHINVLIQKQKKMDALVQDVELLGRSVLLQQLRGDLSLGGQDDTILGQDTNGGTGM